MGDLISRQAAIDALKEHRALYCDNTPDTFSKLSYAEKSRVDELDTAIAILVNLPSAQPEYRLDEWCTDCKEYDTEKHCCPRFNQVIRTTLNEMKSERKKGQWIEVDDSYNRISGRCSACGWEAHMYEDDVVGMWFCPNCGADMRGEQDE